MKNGNMQRTFKKYRDEEYEEWVRTWKSVPYEAQKLFQKTRKPFLKFCETIVNSGEDMEELEKFGLRDKDKEKLLKLITEFQNTDE